MSQSLTDLMAKAAATLPPQKPAKVSWKNLMLQKLEGIEQKLEALKSEPEDKPLTAEQMIKRWNIGGLSRSDRLRNLQRKCARLGLSPMAGSRGMNATYAVAKVLKAEANA